MASAEQNKLQLLMQMLESAETSLATARQIIAEMSGADFYEDGNGNGNKRPTNGLKVADSGRVVEGVFDGANMVGPDGKKYPVPPNYASKSKLVSGDILKLTIAENGSFIYKQIGPVERIQTVGTLKQINNNYVVTTPEGDYKVLTASVTYFKAEPGDRVTLIVPSGSSGGWGAIENVIPKTVQVASNGSKVESRIEELDDEIENFEVPKTLFKRS